MTENEPFQPPYWARLGAWFAGVGVFLNETFIEPQPRFPLLVLDVVFLMGVSPKVVAGLLAAIRGTPPPSAPPPQTPPEPKGGDS